MVQRPLTEGVSNGYALREETHLKQEPTDQWYLAWKVPETLLGLPLRNLSLAYLFENATEAVRLVVQRPFNEAMENG